MILFYRNIFLDNPILFMDFTFILQIVEMVVAVLLIIVVLMQNKGAGLGGIFGGEGNTYSSQRGFQRTLHISTIVLSTIFLGVALASFLL